MTAVDLGDLTRACAGCGWQLGAEEPVRTVTVPVVMQLDDVAEAIVDWLLFADCCRAAFDRVDGLRSAATRAPR